MLTMRRSSICEYRTRSSRLSRSSRLRTRRKEADVVACTHEETTEATEEAEACADAGEAVEGAAAATITTMLELVNATTPDRTRRAS